MRQHVGIDACPIENDHHQNMGGTGCKGFVLALSRVHLVHSEQDANVGDRDDGYRDEQHQHAAGIHQELLEQYVNT